ncbi:MAG: insulinase family protein [Desulfuromonadales bacterium]|nr:insulinase family protein [Desulfuromonadales bacterium]
MISEVAEPGSRIGRFLVVHSEVLTDLNLSAVVLRHEPTGARLLHLACDDPNNVFAVGFRTPPPDSTGIAHILEHTVLCGSERYPVRDPFFAMLKRSLNTFMNAMTAADWTCYPVASMNPKDLANLTGIYLDAVFFPLLREADFCQEGHRLEFTVAEDPTSPLQIKGVVFNEMKGAMADPTSLLGRRLNAALFPDNCYGRNSGGEPLEIPDLTWQALRDFHHRYYHPGNSWIYTYGNQPLEAHLERIETLALSRFQAQAVDSVIAPQPRWQQPRRIETTFPIDAGDDPVDRSMVQTAWLTCPIDDSFERAATNLLANLLLGNPAAPLYQALIESGLGKNLCPGTGYHDDYRDTFLAAGLQGIDPEQADQIVALIDKTLARVAEQGFPAERVAAALQQYEFSNREVTGDQYPYGLSLLMRLLGPWLHADDPLTPLRIGDNLARLRQATADPAFFPNLIRRRLLDNPHRVILIMRPDPEHSPREEAALSQRLQAIDERLDQTARDQLVKQAVALKTAQETPDDLSCLPTLELADITPHEQVPDFSQDGALYRFIQPTNGITYLALQFDLNGLPDELSPYLPLFCSLLPQIGAAGHDYLEMARRITAATGGIRLGTNLLEDPGNLDRVRPVIDLKGKALDSRQDKLIEILIDMLGAPDFNNLERLQTVIGQIRIALENSIPGSGHSFAATAAAAGLTPTAQRREAWSGMSQVRLVNEISRYPLGPEMEHLTNRLRAISRFLRDRQRISLAVTGEAAAVDAMSQKLDRLLAVFPGTEPPPPLTAQPFRPQPAVTGWSHTLPVAYVARVFRTAPYTSADAAPLLVLAKLLRANVLHREIREKGGAYGGLASYNSDGGLLSFLSYRDPHLLRTLDVYRQAIDWACNGSFDAEMLREAVIDVFGDLDRPLSPGGRGYHEFILQRQGLLPELRQQFREAVLTTSRDDLIRVARQYLDRGWGQSSVGILAGGEMFESARTELEKQGLRLQRL